MCSASPIVVATLAVIPASAAQAGTRVVHPQVFSGTVVTASGQPAAGVKVNVYAMPGDGGSQGTLIGSAATASNGQWSLPAPAYAALPKAAQQLAAANMGYLNTDAIVSSGSSFALAVESAWVGTPAIRAEPAWTRPRR